MARREGNASPLDAGLIARAAAGIGAFAQAWRGNNAQWFGPGEPIQPALDPESAQQAGVTGRQLDYVTGLNLQTKPRSGERVNFETLRALADNLDVLRLVIETRKDQLCKLPWSVVYQDANKKPDARCEEATTLLRKPDGRNRWATWLRMVLEDLFVLDAPALYVRQTLGGSVYGFEPIDGGTIKRLIDPTGRTPADGAAYQQVIKGLPAVDYSTDDLIYAPRNLRTNRVYGYGPVEQIINTVHIALRRQQFTLDYFTEGTVPDALAGVPDTWTAEQTKQFQDYWDLLMQSDSENSGQRRRLKFIPGDIAKNYVATKQPPLKDQFDEWIARVVCYCFAIDVTPFVAQVNRSVAETNRAQSLSEGLAPAQQWVVDVVEDMLERAGFEGMTLAWQEGEIVDPEMRQRVLCGYVTAKVMHPDEARKKLGLDPLTEQQRADLMPPPPMLPDDGGDGPGKDGDKPPKGAKGEEDGKKPDTEPEDETGKSLAAILRKSSSPKALRPINRDRRLVKRAQNKLAGHIEAALSAQAAALVERVMAIEPNAAKSEGVTQAATARLVADALEGYEPEWDDLIDLTAGVLVDVASDGGLQALRQIGMLNDPLENAVRDRAEEWAIARAAEMVGMKRIDGVLVPNPDARWQITETTRDAIAGLTSQALDEGWSVDKMAKELAESHAFSDTRAKMIARTEVAKADVSGAMIGYRESGVVTMKRWLTAADDKVSEECVSCEKAGNIGLDENFPTGEDAPPNHPNCRCAVLPVLDVQTPLQLSE